LSFSVTRQAETLTSGAPDQARFKDAGIALRLNSKYLRAGHNIVNKVISMDQRNAKNHSRTLFVKERRYAVRFPFAADAVLIDLDAGTRAQGVTTDISQGGIFVCTSRPSALNARVRITLTRKDQTVEALGVVRIVKAKIGMGVEFIDVESPYDEILSRWIEQLGRTR
jgi:hypothetical protein